MATAAYRDQSDDLGRFLSATCEVGADEAAGACRVKAKPLFETYLAWAEEAGASAWTNKGFKAAMQDKGFDQKTSNGVWWIGIRLRDGVDAAAIRENRWDGPPDLPDALSRDPKGGDSQMVGRQGGDPGVEFRG